MRGWIQKLEAMAAAVTFAERGEWETARTILNESQRRTTQKQTDRIKQPRPRVRSQSYRV